MPNLINWEAVRLARKSGQKRWRNNSPRRSIDNSLKIDNAVYHGHCKDKRSDEANGKCAHNGLGHHALGIPTLLTEMNCPVQTSVHVVGGNEPGQETDAIRPTAVIDEVGPN